MNLKNRLKEMSIDKKRFIEAILIAGLITYALTYTEIWQLILIPTIIAGMINYRNPRKGIYSGALGVLFAWTIYMSIAMISKNSYIFLDQFAGEIFGGLGYGWIVLILILLLGILFGALGGAIGSNMISIIQYRLKKSRNTTEVKSSNKLLSKE